MRHEDLIPNAAVNARRRPRRHFIRWLFLAHAPLATRRDVRAFFSLKNSNRRLLVKLLALFIKKKKKKKVFRVVGDKIPPARARYEKSLERKIRSCSNEIKRDVLRCLSRNANETALPRLHLQFRYTLRNVGEIQCEESAEFRRARKSHSRRSNPDSRDRGHGRG